MIGLHSGSFGFQWGAKDTDLIFVVMNPGGVRDLLKSKGEIGADVSAAAGPVGRTAQADTDLMMNAEILTYSRSRGLFAGVSLKGAAVTADTEANARLYGHLVDDPLHFVFHGGDTKAPAQAKPLISELDRYSPRGGRSFGDMAPNTVNANSTNNTK
jgi:lipid-binding SYLF domain-containing protein